MRRHETPVATVFTVTPSGGSISTIIGRFRAPPTPTGAYSFLFNFIFAKQHPCRRLAPPPPDNNRIGAPNRKSWIRHWPPSTLIKKIPNFSANFTFWAVALFTFFVLFLPVILLDTSVISLLGEWRLLRLRSSDFGPNSVADPGFPVGGGGRRAVGGGGGRRPPTWVLFGENICENERIGSCWGGRRRRPPPPWIRQWN